MSGRRYSKAIERNLAEMQRAILNRTTLLGIERSKGVRALFLQVAYFALFNDYVAHCIKVFEQSKRAASFWYIYRTDQKIVDAFAKKEKIDLAALEGVSTKLKHIRDKTHFHIDAEGVLDTKAIWRDAGLTGKQLSEAVDNAWAILVHLQQQLSLPAVTIPSYYKVTHVHERVVSIEGGAFKS
jgi:hypothetical protein